MPPAHNASAAGQLIKLEVAKYTKVANAAHISADQP